MAEQARLYMQLSRSTGPIPGDSVVTGMKGWIEIDDWSWSLQRKTNADSTEAIEPTKLSFTKRMDRASTSMLLAMHGGDLLTATIKMDDASLVMLNLVIKLHKVRIIGYKVKTQASDKRTEIEEDWDFDYESILFDYRPDLKSGTMSVEIDRPPGSSTTSPNEKLNKFLELSKGMKVEDLEPIWKQIVAKAKEDADKPEDAKDKDKPGKGP